MGAAGQAGPSVVLAAACCTATLRMPHLRLVQPALAAVCKTRRRVQGRRGSLRPDSEQALGFGIPAAFPQHDELLWPALAEFWVNRVFEMRRSATRNAAPSVSAVLVCGCPAPVRGDSRVASQHIAPPPGVCQPLLGNLLVGLPSLAGHSHSNALNDFSATLFAGRRGHGFQPHDGSQAQP